MLMEEEVDADAAQVLERAAEPVDGPRRQHIEPAPHRILQGGCVLEMLEIVRLVTGRLRRDAGDRPGIDPHVLAWFVDDFLEHAVQENRVQRIG